MSDILNTVFETALDLKEFGVINAKKMREIKKLCKPLPEYTAKEVVSLRKKTKLSQTALAELFNVSPATVQSWEHGRRPVKGSGRKLLYVLEKNGIEALI